MVRQKIEKTCLGEWMNEWVGEAGVWVARDPEKLFKTKWIESGRSED